MQTHTKREAQDDGKTQTLICQSPNFFFSLRQFFLSLFLQKSIFFSELFFIKTRKKFVFGFIQPPDETSGIYHKEVTMPGL